MSASPVTERTCERFVNMDGSPPQCGIPASAVVVTACIHEHISEWGCCEECLAELRGYQETVNREVICMDCLESSQPHECRVTPEIRPLPTPGGTT